MSNMIRLDDLENGYFIYQDTDAFCFGIDAVLLAHYPALREGDKVCDLCSGNGIIPLLIDSTAKKTGRNVRITGLELQQPMADLFTRSVAYNHLEDTITAVCGDVKEARALFGPASFSLVTCNPPYIASGSGLTAEADAKKIARHEIACTLEDVISAATGILKEKGRFAMVHRPGRLAEIFHLLHKYRLEPKRMRLVHPYADKSPNMVLIEAVRGGGAQLNIDPPLTVYNADGTYTDEVLRIYGKI